MEILQNPNVTYLFLVSGLLLAVLALFAPGTGVFELAAIFALFIAGYGIYNLPINWWALVILILGVFPFVLAVRRSGRWPYLVVSMAALVIGSAYLFKSRDPGVSPWLPGIHPLLALLVSALAGGLMWLVSHKGLQALSRPSATVLDRVVGAIGKAETPISGEGSVYVVGETWSARSANPIPAKSRVRVIKREGFILEVEELPK